MAKWTSSEDSMLTRLWHKGVPTRVISERIGRSKNSVIGRAYRIGLPMHDGYPVALPEDMTRDWEDYVCGAVTTVDIARKYGVTPFAICARFEREGWPRRDNRAAAQVRWGTSA